VEYRNFKFFDSGNSAKKAEIKWLPNPIKSIFYADPFGFEIDGKKMIIFEDYSKILRRRRIAIAEFDGEKLINKKIILMIKNIFPIHS
jgi:hypothetical protein